MNDATWHVMRELLIKKTNAGFLKWRKPSHQDQFTASLGKVEACVREDRFLLVDGEDGATISERMLVNPADREVFEVARYDAMDADAEIDRALVFLSNL
jgi:hypothetical protein